MTTKLERLKDLRPHERHRVRYGKRGAYQRRPRYSEGEMLGWLRSQDIHSANQLRRTAKTDPSAPTVYTVLKTLNERLWVNAMQRVWGTPPPGMPEDMPPTHEYLIGLCLRHKIRVRADWDRVRAHEKKYPPLKDALPSRHWVDHLFGNWTNLKAVLQEERQGDSLMQYAQACQSAGRPLTLKECEERGINTTALKRLGKKKDIDGIFSVIPDSSLSGICRTYCRGSGSSQP